MRFNIVLLLLVQWSFQYSAVTLEKTEIIKELATWKVADYSTNPFKHWSLSQFKKRLIQKPKRSARTPGPHPPITETFDPRTTSSTCKPHIIDQGQCASSWAISVANSLGNRFCMQGNKRLNNLSSQYMVSCDKDNYGCRGGYLFEGFNFATTTGIPTETCVPYNPSFFDVLKCPNACLDKQKFIHHKCAEDSIKDLSYLTTDIMAEVRIVGAVAASMIVYGDFIYYAEGIYKHVHGDDLGRQGITIIGYGEKDGISYWICANSWGTEWGEDGWFKIAFGEADIEGDVWTCMPELDITISQ